MNTLPGDFMAVLSENEQAMRHFAGLSDETQEQIAAQARGAASLEEMRAIVRSLA